MTKWEYLCEDRDSNDYDLNDLLDRHGEEGWEPVGVAVLDNCVRHYFKRPLCVVDYSLE